MHVERARPVHTLGLALAAAALMLTGPSLLAQEAVTGTRDPAQRMDEEFAESYARWTSEARYGSPLVDHLPRVPGIPTPKDILGHHVGAPETLTYYEDIL
ncbi:MAG: hypothetical protein ABIF09_18760, partial [Gemmatimonadota bacterium]